VTAAYHHESGIISVRFLHFVKHVLLEGLVRSFPRVFIAVVARCLDSVPFSLRNRHRNVDVLCAVLFCENAPKARPVKFPFLCDQPNAIFLDYSAQELGQLFFLSDFFTLARFREAFRLKVLKKVV